MEAQRLQHVGGAAFAGNAAVAVLGDARASARGDKCRCGGDVKRAHHVAACADDVDGIRASRHGLCLLAHHAGKSGDLRDGFPFHAQCGYKGTDLRVCRAAGHNAVHRLDRFRFGQIFALDDFEDIWL